MCCVTLSFSRTVLPEVFKQWIIGDTHRSKYKLNISFTAAPQWQVSWKSVEWRGDGWITRVVSYTWKCRFLGDPRGSQKCNVHLLLPSFTGLARALATSSRHICRPRGPSASEDSSPGVSAPQGPVAVGHSRATSPEKHR